MNTNKMSFFQNGIQMGDGEITAYSQRLKGRSVQKKQKLFFSVEKVMAIVFWENRGVILSIIFNEEKPLPEYTTHHYSTT